MTKLNTIIEISFRSEYGDGDYRVSCSDLTIEQLNKLIITTHHALHTLVDNWRRNQQQDVACQTTKSFGWNEAIQKMREETND